TADVGGGRRVVCQGVQVGQAAHLFRLAAGGQGFVYRDDVGGARQIDEPRNMLPDQAVVVAIEVVFHQHVADAVKGGIVQQQATEHGLLGFNGMGGNPQVIELRVALHDGVVQRRLHFAGTALWSGTAKKGKPV